MPCLVCNTMIDHDEVIDERIDDEGETVEVAVWTCASCGNVQVEPL